MGVTKTDFFTAKQNNMAVLLKAMGHPARIAIMEHLLKIDKCICGEIVDEVGLAQATISQHLKELKNAGLIKGSIEKTSICYCINEVVFSEVQKYFSSFSTKLKEKKCC